MEMNYQVMRIDYLNPKLLERVVIIMYVRCFCFVRMRAHLYIYLSSN